MQSKQCQKTQKRKVVTISYKDLVAATLESSLSPSASTSMDPLLTEKIGYAFGKSNDKDGNDALGIIAVRDIPKFSELRRNLLHTSKRLATELSEEQLDDITIPSAKYQVGWSHGKEKLQGGKFDTAKGSFYANPLTDDLLESIRERRRAPKQITKKTSDEQTNRYSECDGMNEMDSETVVEGMDDPAFFAPNVWPTKSLPELEPTFKDMGKLICHVGRMVASLCDAYVSRQCPGYAKNKLRDILTDSLNCKARLLHYYAKKNKEGKKEGQIAAGEYENESDEGNCADEGDFGDWCGWHNDHGSLTGLVPAMYLDDKTDDTEIPSPDPEAGLYVLSHSGKRIQVHIPSDAVAFQVGETMQIHTGGILLATPHAVRGYRSSASGKVTRESFAVFMEPEYDGVMDIPVGRTVEDVQGSEAEERLPKTVKTLRSRWKEGMNFGEFSSATYETFY